MAIDGRGNLFVSNLNSTPNSVVEFTPPFTSSNQPAVTITSGVNEQGAIGLSPAANLFVPNQGANTVTEYGPPYSGAPTTIIGGQSQPVALAVDASGRVHDGDELIALAARGLASRGELGGGVVVTVMTNFGFHQAMAEDGIEVAITQVGDRYVIDEMLRREWKLGGEQSGHIIATDIVSTGDGIAAALLTMRELGDSTLAAAPAMDKLPQRLVNVKVADRESLTGAVAVWAQSCVAATLSTNFGSPASACSLK